MASNRAGVVYSWLAADARSSNERISNAVLCRSARQHLEVDGASVTLMAQPAEQDRVAFPQLQEPVATSDVTSARLEELHLTLGEGPSTEAFTHAVPILVPDLHETTRRWPGFTPAALAKDVAAVFAFPLNIDSLQAGVLTAHRASPGALPPQALADMSVFAELAAQLLPTEPAQPLTSEIRPADGPAGERDEVHQAVGMLAVQLGVSMQDAFTRLRTHAFAHDLPLAELSQHVITGRAHLPADPGFDT